MDSYSYEILKSNFINLFCPIVQELPLLARLLQQLSNKHASCTLIIGFSFTLNIFQEDEALLGLWGMDTGHRKGFLQISFQIILKVEKLSQHLRIAPVEIDIEIQCFILHWLQQAPHCRCGTAAATSFYFIKSRQRDKRQRALLQYQNFYFLYYLGWSGSFLHFRQNIMKVIQS